MKITKDNWQFTRLTSGKLLAFIAFGATPSEGKNSLQYEYTVLMTDLEYKEVYSKAYTKLEEAILVVNLKYKDWDIFTSGTSSTGCDSCAAH